jgi:hypothetical protein
MGREYAMPLPLRAALLAVAAASTALAVHAQTIQFDAAHAASLTVGTSNVVSCS